MLSFEWSGLHFNSNWSVPTDIVYVELWWLILGVGDQGRQVVCGLSVAMSVAKWLTVTRPLTVMGPGGCGREQTQELQSVTKSLCVRLTQGPWQCWPRLFSYFLDCNRKLEIVMCLPRGCGWELTVFHKAHCVASVIGRHKALDNVNHKSFHFLDGHSVRFPDSI